MERGTRTRSGVRWWAPCLAVTVGWLFVASTQARLPVAAPPDPPQVEFKNLFVAVQTTQLFPDGKAFPDAVPRASPADILERYRAESPRSRDALKHFVEAHFSLPVDAQTAPSPPERVPIVAHIDQLWDVLTRRTPSVPPYASLLPLPQPYVVPGGRFREIYYWDSYFTMLGLEESGRQDLVEDMVRDFAHLIDIYGHIPNGTRTYYLSRSQPPFFFAMVALLSGSDPGAAFARFLPQLRKEHAFWMEGAGKLAPGAAHRRVVGMPDGAILNRYWDDRDTARDESYDNDLKLARDSHREASQLFRDVRAACESGWDFSSRWFDDARTRATVNTTEIIPVDLNSLMFGLEKAIWLGCERQGDKVCAQEFSQRSAGRRAAMNRYLWDTAAGAYLDYRWSRQARVPRISAASLYPLFVGAASDQQATLLDKVVARDLLKDGGIVTTTLETGQQWDAPNGWAPLQWVAISGLRQYGKLPLAEAIACRWMANVNRVYADTGKLVEKYDVVAIRKGGGGEYPLQDGFGWTNGVMRKLVSLYPADAAFSTMEQCPKT
jgi:alpha,alpha-trehalase